MEKPKLIVKTGALLVLGVLLGFWLGWMSFHARITNSDSDLHFAKVDLFHLRTQVVNALGNDNEETENIEQNFDRIQKRIGRIFGHKDEN
ncbi:hypothetical protein P3T73_06940 [Kiritimatiellota bacterium B12222]|nr:hypothetical protein P3T73_06940 [Kiritimatiellota bacterium B12222]